MFHFKPKQVGKCRESEKIKLSVRSVPTRRVIENSKKIAKKIQKFKKHYYDFFSSKNKMGKAKKE